MSLGLSACAAVTDHLPASLQPAAIAPSAAPASAPPEPAAKPAELERPPVDPSAQRAFDDARRALRAGRIEQAERAFRALVKSHPELGGPHANLGLIYGQAGKLNEAVAELEEAARVSPQQPLYFNHLGIAYRQQGQFAKAREAYEKAIELAPEYPAPLLNLGILHDLYLGDGRRALELYDRYLALSPGGDAQVTKWVADLKNRHRQVGLLTPKEKP
jgi:Flp pilus assembly protein TadD